MYDGYLSLIMMFGVCGMYIPVVLVNNIFLLLTRTMGTYIHTSQIKLLLKIILFVKPHIAGIYLHSDAHKIQHL